MLQFSMHTKWKDTSEIQVKTILAITTLVFADQSFQSVGHHARAAFSVRTEAVGAAQPDL